MRIAVLNLTGGGYSGGYKRYLSSTLPLLAASEHVSEILCASPSSLGVETWLSGVPKIRFANCSPFRFMRHSPDAALKSILDDFGPDLIFIPLERYIKYRDVPVVTVLHNMAPLSGLKVTAGVREKIKCLAQYRETKVAMVESDAIIAPTQHVRDFLINKWGVDKNKVALINFGASPIPKSVRPPAGFKVPERFIFTAGAMEVYRGLEDLVLAMPELKSAFPGLKLLVAGGARAATLSYLGHLKTLAARQNVADDIYWLGNIPGEELSWCYKNCSAFVMTSRVESFSFVALEAMQHGCACVSSDSQCLPEIFHDAAEYYAAGDISGLNTAVKRMLGWSPDERRSNSAIAVKLASGYSWNDSADKTLDVFKSVVYRR